MSLDSAGMEEADFLTLQGTVWSRAAGQGPMDPESSRSGQNQWVVQTFGKGGVPGLESVGSEWVGQQKGVWQCGVGRGSGLREGVCSVLWEEASWNHPPFPLLMTPLVTRAGCPMPFWDALPTEHALESPQISISGWEPWEQGQLGM